MAATRPLLQKDLLLPTQKDSIIHKNGSAPASASLRNKCPRPLDQLSLSSCVAHAELSAYAIMTNNSKPLLSRLYLYAGARDKPLKDDGSSSLTALNYFMSNGICEEKLWPYELARVNIIPPSELKTNAKQYKTVKSQRLTPGDLNTAKIMIARGIPVITGLKLYQSFSSAGKTGIVPMPLPNEKYKGAHCVLMIGYDDATQMATFLNSFGDRWGDRGFFTTSYDYILKYSLNQIVLFV